MEQSKKKTETSQKSLSTYLKPKLKAMDACAMLLTNEVALFIAKSLHSYSTVEEPAFHYLTTDAAPEFVILSQATFSHSVVLDLYEQEL